MTFLTFYLHHKCCTTMDAVSAFCSIFLVFRPWCWSKEFRCWHLDFFMEPGDVLTSFVVVILVWEMWCDVGSRWRLVWHYVLDGHGLLQWFLTWGPGPWISGLAAKECLCSNPDNGRWVERMNKQCSPPSCGLRYPEHCPIPTLCPLGLCWSVPPLLMDYKTRDIFLCGMWHLSENIDRKAYWGHFWSVRYVNVSVTFSNKMVCQASKQPGLSTSALLSIFSPEVVCPPSKQCYCTTVVQLVCLVSSSAWDKASLSVVCPYSYP